MTSDPAAAFEVAKGQRTVMLLSEADVAALLDPATLLDALADGFRALAEGEVQSPPRPQITLPGAGFSLAMSAWRPGSQICVKVVNVFDGNLDQGLPNHLAMITLFAPDTGATTCVMDGTYITGIRTAAAAVLSTRVLSRPESSVATIVGAGVQAREHLRMLPLVRRFEQINICSLVDEHAARLATEYEQAVARPDLDAAIRESDVVCLATHAPNAVIDPSWIRQGTHVSSVGYYPPGGELPPELARGNALFVEHLDALQPAPVGCAELSGVDDAHATTLGDVVAGRAPGRTESDAITVYKAMGIAMEDLVAANLAYDRAVQDGFTTQSMTW
ncbi:MAG TPA: ornithine cyclodeaminase family protein [Jatrophihabitans sp.]|jgi:ornithine cyclodeaminase/alanine dehydrogenase-like protein (mu-crystallin family)|nr:ornithine cyclodeaminase family protein [Jatrophihabitans sp.]